MAREAIKRIVKRILDIFGIEIRKKIGSKIAGTGSYVPKEVLDNEFFVKNSPYKVYIGEDDKGEPRWREKNGDVELVYYKKEKDILRNNGIRERRRAALDETTLDMAKKASLNALEDANIEAKDLRAIIVACVTQERDYPSLACELQRELNALNVDYAADLKAGCAGSVYALDSANTLIRYNSYGPCLVIGVERLTGRVDYTERNCTLFGDGAGAIVLVPDKKPNKGVLATQFYSNANCDKTKWLFADKYRLARMPQGKRVFKLGVKNMVKAGGVVIEKAAKQFGNTFEEMRDLIKYYFPHQANIRMLKSVEEGLGLGKVYINIEYYGNTSAATWMIALDEARKKGLINVGDYNVIVSFGTGLVTGGALIKL